MKKKVFIITLVLGMIGIALGIHVNLKDKAAKLNLEPMNGSFEYVKNIQKKFDDSKIIYSNEYYDTSGLDRPDGTGSEISV